MFWWAAMRATGWTAKVVFNSGVPRRFVIPFRLTFVFASYPYIYLHSYATDSLSVWHFYCPFFLFLHGVRIACYAEPCISYDRVVRLSVHLSHASIEWKWHKLGSQNLHRRITQGFYFLGTKSSSRNSIGITRKRALNESGVGKIRNFHLI